MSMKWLLLSLVLVFVASPVVASGSAVVVVDDLGKVSGPVGNRSEEARGEALREGLEEVLVRITGNRDVAELSLAQELLRRPRQWLEQYGYVEGDEGLLLEARYNVSGLSEQLARGGEALWGETRPVVLLWLVDESGSIVAEEGESELREVASRRARHRGLPLVWPRMDEQDRASIVAADIRGRFDRQLNEASRRYPAGLIVTAVVYPGTRPSVRWRLLHDQQSLKEGTLEVAAGQATRELMVELLDLVADHVASIYAVVMGDGTGLTLTVDQLDSLAAYDSVSRHVGGLAGMQSMRLLGLQGGRAEFELEFSGPPLQLERLLHLHGSLGPCEQLIGEEPAADAGMRVCWSADE